MNNDPTARARRLDTVERRVAEELERLEELTPERRLPAALDVLEVLEALAARARQARAGAVLDLRRRGRRTQPKTWREVALITGRDVTPQAAQQWADQYRAAR